MDEEPECGYDECTNLCMDMDCSHEYPHHCERSHYVKVMNQLDAEPHRINEKGTDGLSGLHKAVQSGCPMLCELYLDIDGVDVNTRSKNHFTPLMISCFSGFDEITSDLLDNGADPNRQNCVSHTAAMVSVFSNNISSIDALAKCSKTDWNKVESHGNNVALLATENGKPKMLERLSAIDSIDWNMRNFNDETVLSTALKSNSCDTIETVLSIPQIEYDIDYLKRKQLHEKALKECKKYLAELSDDKQDLEATEELVEVAFQKGLIYMAIFIGVKLSRISLMRLLIGKYTEERSASECPANSCPECRQNMIGRAIGFERHLQLE